jgi:hypothetical protein
MIREKHNKMGVRGTCAMFIAAEHRGRCAVDAPD